MPNLFTIALGANIRSTVGSPKDTLEFALKLFAGEGLQILRQSKWYSTPAFPAGAGPDYVNAAVLISSTQTPEQVLDSLNRIESATGRVRLNRWESRVCDLDLLACGEKVLPDAATLNHWITLASERQLQEVPDRLLLPHPRLHERAFVLVPLRDIAPDWMHPVLHQTPEQMLKKLPQEDIAAILEISQD